MKQGSKGRTSEVFSRTTPDSIGRARGDLSALTQISAIEVRASRVKEKARRHFEKYVESWVAREGIDLWRRRAGLSSGVAPQTLLAKEYAGISVMAEARRNVHARLAQRLTKINAIRIRLSNTVIRNMETLQPTRTHKNAPAQKRGSPEQ